MQKPPLPYLTGEPVLEPEDPRPPPEAPVGRHVQYFLFFVPREPRSKREIIRWWEKRRFAYNVLVGAFNSVVLSVLNLVLPNKSPWEELVVYAVAVGIAANICYCAGWIFEIVLQQYFVRYYRHRVARILMNMVLGISVFVVLSPILLTSILGLLGIIP